MIHGTRRITGGFLQEVVSELGLVVPQDTQEERTVWTVLPRGGKVQGAGEVAGHHLTEACALGRGAEANVVIRED